MNHERIADVLETAVACIEKHGWCQDVRRDAVGRTCALGAIDEATLWAMDQAMVRTDAINAFRDMLSKQLASDRWALVVISDWNDSPGRTEQEVLDVFRLAAKEQRMIAEGIA